MVDICVNRNLDVARMAFLSIIQLSTCDKSLFNDGIDEEIEIVAKRGLKALEDDLKFAARRTQEQDG